MADTTFVDRVTPIMASWLNDVNDFTYDAPSSSDAAKGAALMGFNPSLNYPLNTVGWGIRASQSDYNILLDIPPAEWAAVLDGTTTVDHSSILQARIDAMAASIGGTIYIPGTLLCNTPIVLKSTVNLRGAGERTSRIKKDSTTTKAVTIVAGAMVVYTPVTLPSNINAILVLTDNTTGSDGRYNGSISDITLEGTLATPGDYETQKVEFGIVSVGSVSDSHFQNVTITSCTYAMIFPSIFASYIQRCKWNTCLSGLSIDNGTSVNILSNYSNYSRDWGYFIRDVKYTLIAGNACDSTNSPTKYPTRTRDCSAYRLRSALGVTFCANGDEDTFGNSIDLETIATSSIFNHQTFGLGSDYIGANDIAWLRLRDSVIRSSAIYNNSAIGVKAGGLTYGGANAAKHHNIYAATPTNVLTYRFDNNVASAARTSTNVEAGWGNNSLAAQPNTTGVTAASYSQLITDTHIIANRAGTVTLTLLDPSYVVGAEVTVRTIQNQAVASASANVVPLAGGAAGTPILAATAGKWARLKSNGTNWEIIAAG